MQAYFYKYQALGNDMVVLDPAKFDQPLTPALTRLMCDRHFGLGADGVCYGPLPDSQYPHTMRFFNPDGTEAAKSGNGLRIFARYLWDQGYVSTPSFQIRIHGEAIQVAIKNTQATLLALAMGQLSFNSKHIPVSGPQRDVVEETMMFANMPTTVTAATIGNPHCVIFSDHAAANDPMRRGHDEAEGLYTAGTFAIRHSQFSTEQPLAELARSLGPVIETAPQFLNRTNVQFVQIINQHTIAIEIWERGAGYTLASGTSACAAAGAAVKTGRCISPVEVRMAGGSATVEVDAKGYVTLTGAVEAICSGTFSEDFIKNV